MADSEAQSEDQSELQSELQSGRPVWAGWRASSVIAAVFVCLILFAHYGVEWVDREIDLGYTEEARRDPYLAAAMFLTQQGIAGETSVGLSLLDDLPSVDDAILMTTSRRTLSERRLADLEAWVVAGGHLVLAAEEVFDPERGQSRDPFLDRLGIYLNSPEDEESDPDSELDSDLDFEGDLAEDSNSDADGLGQEIAKEDSNGNEIDETAEIDEPAPATLEAVLEQSFSGMPNKCRSDEDPLAYMPVGDTTRIELDLSGRNFLSTENGTGQAAYSSAGAQLVQVPLGSGLVTAATSTRIWVNSRIHCHDHAYLLWLLSRGRAKLWLQHDPDVPSLIDLLAGNFPLAGTGFAALFVVWAAFSSQRFGPRRIVEVGQRRELLEHLQATADFGWRGALLRSPLAALREDLRKRLDRGRAPELDAARGEPAARLAKITGLARADVEFALAGDPLLKKRDFVKTMKILATSRRQL